MSELALGVNGPLAMSNEEVARLTAPERQIRVQALMAESRELLHEAIDQHVTADDKRLAAVVVLFSGGNDSTTLAHLFRHEATHAAHANTTIGIEQTREFVRNTCEEWGLPLIERTPPREADHYRALVLDQGFPGPAHHFKMYQRLKERALRQIRSELVTSRNERVVFVAGRRRTESTRRAMVPEMERIGSTVWVSPLINWTKLDLNTYRLMAGDVPVNQITDLIHMSGECLCGSFAAPGEREEIAYWFPLAFAEIEALEAEIADRDHIPDARKKWGHGTRGKADVIASGRLCSSCDDRFQAALNLDGVA